MYRFIYYYFYIISIKRNPVAKDSAAFAAALAILLHVTIMFSLFKKISGIQVPQVGNIQLALLVVLLFVITSFYVNRLKTNFEKIEAKYQNTNVTSWVNSLLVILNFPISILLIYLIETFL